MAAACAGLVAGSFVLVAWYDLHPCHLCIFQRLLFMKLTVLAALAGLAGVVPGLAWLRWLAGLSGLVVAGLGLGVASHQSWLQAQPPGSVSCLAGEPGWIERLVEWLGQRMPELFLATGFCDEVEIRIVGLSLAHWALVGFTAFLIGAVWALWLGRVAAPPSRKP
jgi:disulfide bond formation protein DsbB